TRNALSPIYSGHLDRSKQAEVCNLRRSDTPLVDQTAAHSPIGRGPLPVTSLRVGGSIANPPTVLPQPLLSSPSRFEHNDLHEHAFRSQDRVGDGRAFHQPQTPGQARSFAGSVTLVPP